MASLRPRCGTTTTKLSATQASTGQTGLWAERWIAPVEG